MADLSSTSSKNPIISSRAAEKESVSSSSAPISSSFSANDIPWESWANVVSFLTLFEWVECRTLSKIYHEKVCLKALERFKCLDLSQFWAVLGDENALLKPAVLQPIVAGMTSIQSINVSYCNSIKDSDLVQWLRLVPVEVRPNITSLNLYYCQQLSNASVLNVLRMFPNLIKLNLGSCTQLTDACIPFIVKFSPGLKQLVLSNNFSLTNEILVDLGCHPSLELVDLRRVRSIDNASIEEQKLATPQITILGPDHQLDLPYSRPNKTRII